MKYQIMPDIFLDAIELGKWLFKYVYTEVSAAVYVDGQNRVIDIRAFDSTFGSEAVEKPVRPEAERVLFYTARPVGLPEPGQVDEFNLSKLTAVTALPVEPYWVCEDECVPMIQAA